MTEEKNESEVQNMLWNAGRSECPPPAALKQAAVSLGVAGSVTILTSKALAILSSGAGKAAVGITLFGVGTALVVAGQGAPSSEPSGAGVSTSQPVQTAPVVEAPSDDIAGVAAVVEPMAEGASNEESPLPDVREVDAPEEKKGRVSTRRAKQSETDLRSPSSPKEDVSPSETLAAEIRLVDQVRGALAKGEHDKALALCEIGRAHV